MSRNQPSPWAIKPQREFRMSNRARVLVAVLCTLLGPSVAFGQSASGSLVGYVFDQGGTPIKGVKVTTTSPTQIGGAKTTYSNDEGYFRFAALFPGTFEVRASAPKLKTIIQKDV